MKWWQEAVVYQVYPRSFMDSNNDGIGDIQGIISKLDYINYLGANVIWLSPVYQSPNDDNGYDISDYYSIMSEFGTMEDMDKLIEEADKRGIKIIMDLVANHTSTEHEWFKQAIENPYSKYHGYYCFMKNKGEKPNDIQSVFLGSAWELTPNGEEYFLHMFAKSQADLNWHNHEVREDLYGMINWWLEKGIGGFRLDVIDYVAKEIDNKIITDGPKLHEYIREMTEKTFKNYDVMTVGETWGADTEKAIKYSNLEGTELSMIFNFSHLLLDQEGDEKWDYKEVNLLELKKNFEERQLGLFEKGWDALFWCNHDLPRIVSRWGNDKELRIESAKMLATVLHFMQGTPYIYQGEELGMTNVDFSDINEYRDIETLNMYKNRLDRGFTPDSIMKSIHHIGRDNARTPMQWDDSKFAGFSKHEPWIGVNDNYKQINVSSQTNDKQSVLHYYKRLVAFRREGVLKDLIRSGSFELMDKNNPDVFSYKRTLNGQEVVVVCNFKNHVVPYEIQYGEIIISNYDNHETGIHLRPYEAIVYVP
jgi:oligo-1,6-glucosidase/glucan 1,6-alpha-glucosidase